MEVHDIWSPAKVFSPTTAKQRSIQHQEWAFIDAWLTTKFSPSPIPPFERNTETLKALLTLATTNETADEASRLTGLVKQKALSSLKSREEEAMARTSLQDPLLPALEEHLTEEGSRCLNSLALLSVAVGSSSAESKKLATSLVGLRMQEMAVSRQVERVHVLLSKVNRDLEELQENARRVKRGKEFAVPVEMAGRVTEWARNSRVLANKVEDYKERLEGMEANLKGTRIAQGLSVPSVVGQEREILALKERVLELEEQVNGYHALPTTPELAHIEVEKLQAELDELEATRENLYDKMIGS